MADLLGDIQRAASSFATTVTKDAGAFVSNAQANVAQLSGSGVRAGRVVGPLAEAFGSDPVQFTLNSVKHFDKFMRAVANRVADRGGLQNYDAPVPTGKGGTVRVKAHVTSKDNSAHVALVIALAAQQHGAALLEEAGRELQGIPSKRGLDGGEGFVWHPVVLPARGFFGIDEAAAGAAALAIIVAIAPGIILALVSAASAAAPSVIAAITGQPSAEQKKQEADAKAAEESKKILGLDPLMFGIGAIVIVGIVVAALAMRKHGHAAPAAA